MQVELHIEDTRTEDEIRVLGTYDGVCAQATIIGRTHTRITLLWTADDLHPDDARLMLRADTDAWTAYALLAMVAKKGQSK